MTKTPFEREEKLLEKVSSEKEFIERVGKLKEKMIKGTTRMTLKRDLEGINVDEIFEEIVGACLREGRELTLKEIEDYMEEIGFTSSSDGFVIKEYIRKLKSEVEK